MKRIMYVLYARICVYLDISKVLPESIKLSWHDEEWLQAIDYEHILFYYRKCHEYGNIFRECPLNASSLAPQLKNGEKDTKGLKRLAIEGERPRETLA